jgi:hypothetical protein
MHRRQHGDDRFVVPDWRRDGTSQTQISGNPQASAARNATTGSASSTANICAWLVTL